MSLIMWPLAIIGQRLQVHKRRGANLQPMRRAAAFADDVKTEFALRVLRREIDLARRRVDALGDVDEMVDQFLHLRQHGLLLGQQNLGVGRIPRAVGHAVDGLLEDAHALPHLFHAHEITVVTVARPCRRGYRNRNSHSRCTDAPCECPIRRPNRAGSGPSRRNRSHPPSVSTPMSRVRSMKMRLRVSSLSISSIVAGNSFRNFRSIGTKSGRHIVGKSADARVTGREPRAADAFAQIVNLFAFAERVEEDRHRADVHGEAADAQQMRADRGPVPRRSRGCICSAAARPCRSIFSTA